MHWYVLSTVTGVVTLCASEADARREAEAFDRLYPNAAPHIATRLVPVEAADKIERLRDALDHIARVALGSRKMTKRTAWIVERAKSALDGGESWQIAEKPKGYHDALHLTPNAAVSGCDTKD